ncbi:MAG: hypothetical protein K1X78_26895 [Verrucomicrobiaceae bacterium]|nr:hypothetical protein [Verrucomicrobiaceae bacterium]
MQQIKKLLSLHPITVSDAVITVLVGVWVVLVVLGLWSVFSIPRSMLSRVAWSLLIVFVPIAGLLSYSLACLFSADWGILTQMGFFSRSREKIASSLVETPIPNATKSPSP